MPVKIKVATSQWQSGDSAHCWVLVNNKTTARDDRKKYPKHHRNWHNLNKILEQNATEEEIWRVSECWRSWEHLDQQNALLVTKGSLTYNGSMKFKKWWVFWSRHWFPPLLAMGGRGKPAYRHIQILQASPWMKSSKPRPHSSLYSQILDSCDGFSTRKWKGWDMGNMAVPCPCDHSLANVGERVPHRAPQGSLTASNHY